METSESAITSADAAQASATLNAESEARNREYERLWMRFHERRNAAFPAIKTTIFDALQAAGVTRVTIEFNGSSDSGQMEQATAFKDDEEVVSFPATTIEVTHVIFDEENDTLTKVSLRDAIETIAYDLLEQTHEGWENDEGGFGVFTFDVTERTVTLDLDERYTATNNSFHTF